MSRKIGAPRIDELAIGAVTADGSVYLDEEAIETLGVPHAYLEHAIGHEAWEASRRAVGQYYQDFSQTTDEEVRRLLIAVRVLPDAPAHHAP